MTVLDERATSDHIEITQLLQRYFRAAHFDGKLLPSERVESFPSPPWRNQGKAEAP